MDAGGEHFVLVHGAGHGAWCWSKLVPLLQGSGHRVTGVDLAGAGSSPVDPGSVRSFDDYTAPLVDFLSARPDGEKVTLVGHSAGGLSLTHAMHLFSDRIKLAIVKRTHGAGTRLKNCSAGFGTLSWAAAVGGAAHGGRSTLEFQKQNPHEEDAIHVVFSGW